MTMTQQELKAVLSYDPLTGIFMRLKNGKKAGAERPDGRIQIWVKNKLYKAHRLAWLYTYGSLSDLEIDHINGDPSDNRISNLRQATNRQNKWNSRVRSHNRLGVKGVQQRGKTFTARINVNGKTLCLGTFKSSEEANSAYYSAAKEHFGEFSCKGDHLAN